MIQTINYQNPATGGTAVYGARALLRIDINDDNNGYSLKQIMPADTTQNGNDYFQVFPNPSNGKITLLANKKYDGNVRLILTDMFGRDIYTGNLKTNDASTSINISQFNNGVYTLTFNIENKFIQKVKIVIQK